MEKKKKKIIKKNYKNMDLLKDLKMSPLNFKFVMIYIIHKMLVLVKNNLNYLKDSIFIACLKSIINFYFKKKITFFIIYSNRKFKS